MDRWEPGRRISLACKLLPWPPSLLLEPDPLAKGGPKCAHSFAEKNAARTFRRRREEPPALCERFTLQRTLIPDGDMGQKFVPLIPPIDPSRTLLCWKNVLDVKWQARRQIGYKEHQNQCLVCGWENFLPGPACVLLSKTYKPFRSPLYIGVHEPSSCFSCPDWFYPSYLISLQEFYWRFK